MTRIFIENNELDISKGLSNEITYSIDDITKIDSKTTTFSKTIILPGTANNNRLLGNIFDFNNANLTNRETSNVLYNFDASRSAVTRIEVDGLQIVKGVLRLLEIVQLDGNIEYECAIFGELGGFVSALGNKKIEDLDFSAYDISWNATNIVGSWNTIAGSGIYAPLIEHSSESTNSIDFEYTAFRPAFYVREILEKIVANSGYTMDFPFISTPFFNTLVIPTNQMDVTKLSTTLSEFRPTPGTYSSITRVPLTQITLGSFTFSGGNTLTYGGASSVVANIKWQVGGQFITTVPVGTTVDLTLWKNSTVLRNQSYFVSSNPQSFNFTIDLTNITISPGDVIYIGVSTNITSIRISAGTLLFTTSTPTRVPVNYGETLIMNDCIPLGIFQKDFFTSIMKMFNLMVTEDKYKPKHLVIKPYKDFYDGTTIDWSDKLDRKKAIKQKPMSEINARYYNFKYKKDVDFYNENYFKKFNEGYGDRLYDNEYEFAKDTEENEVIFASSVLFKSTLNDKVYPAIYKKSNANTAKDKMSFVIRIMQAQKISGVTSWLIKNAGVTVATLTSYGYAGHLYFGGGSLLTPTIDINFGAPLELQFDPTTYPSDNLFNTYYSPYMSEIANKDSRLITAYFKLTDLDIFNIDFSKFIYIDGGLYRLQKIYDYSPENHDTIKVDLLRVINKTY